MGRLSSRRVPAMPVVNLPVSWADRRPASFMVSMWKYSATVASTSSRVQDSLMFRPGKTQEAEIPASFTSFPSRATSSLNKRLTSVGPGKNSSHHSTQRNALRGPLRHRSKLSDRFLD